MKLHNESRTEKLPTYRQWLREQTQFEGKTLCHLVVGVFTPKNYDDYSFVTEFYRYIVKAEKLDIVALKAMFVDDVPLFVFTCEDSVNLCTADELPEDFVHHAIKGEYVQTHHGYVFNVQGTNPIPPNQPTYLRKGRSRQVKG